MKTNVIHQGDCLEKHDNIDNGSVDLILTDPPYGNMKGFDYSVQPHQKEGSKSAEDLNWDDTLSPKDIFNIANRILRKNGRLILFSQQPYTTELIKEQIPNLPHSYNMIWKKTNFANCLLANKAPVNHYEEILVFKKKNPKYDSEFNHPLREYFADVKEFIGKSKTHIMDVIGQKADHTFRTNSSQFSLCTKETYNELIKYFSIDKMDNFKEYNKLQKIDKPFKNKLNDKKNSKFPSIFNLPEGKNVKSNILEYTRDADGYHPTQKPVALLEDLIKTYTNEGDLVVDLTAGSGSTGVACRNTNRDYILIEKKQEYYEIAKERLNEKKKQLF